MAEVQHVVSGFNVGGLDPIEVAKPVTGTTITLTDTDIGKMNVFTGSANTTVVLPSVAGLLGGYSKSGRIIGFRCRHDFNARITLQSASGELFAALASPNTFYLGANHIVTFYADAANSKWVVLRHYWPPKTGYVLAYRSANVALASGTNNLIYDQVASGNADGWYNASTGIYSPTLPGLYRIHCSQLIQSSSTNTNVISRITKSGNPAFGLGRMVIAATGQAASFAGGITLEALATDSFQPTVFVSAAATLIGDPSDSVLQVEYAGQ